MTGLYLRRDRTLARRVWSVDQCSAKRAELGPDAGPDSGVTSGHDAQRRSYSALRMNVGVMVQPDAQGTLFPHPVLALRHACG